MTSIKETGKLADKESDSSGQSSNFGEGGLKTMTMTDCIISPATEQDGSWKANAQCYTDSGFVKKTPNTFCWSALVLQQKKLTKNRSKRGEMERVQSHVSVK